MSAIESGVICGGADRAVHVYDTKKWAARGHWSNALKYEVRMKEARKKSGERRRN